MKAVNLFSVKMTEVSVLHSANQAKWFFYAF